MITQDHKMAAAKEQILLEFPGTRYKKQEGTLYISNSRIFWVDDATNEYKVNYHYSQIKSQRISPDGASKVQLQCILHDTATTNFHFTGEGALSNRDKAKELLQKLLPQFRAKPSAALEEKKTILSQDQSLQQLYKELVTGGIITPEEFWANRKVRSLCFRVLLYFYYVSLSLAIIIFINPSCHHYITGSCSEE